MIDDRLYEFATHTQRKYLDLIKIHGTARKVERELKLGNDTVQKSLRALRRAAAAKGYAPEHEWVNPVPETHNAARVSSHYTKGVLDQQWVIATLDEKKAAEARQAALEALAATLPRLAPVPGPESSNDRLLTVYTMTDCHVGMLSWGKETGQPWDLEIAERTLTGVFMEMVASSPASKNAYISQLGDFMHTNGTKAVTPGHEHLLDADGRFPKMVEVAVRILRRLVSAALEKHEHVHVLMAEGNHDPDASVWLRAMFAAIYENEPRVTVINSPFPYYAHQHGETMVAFHHGHLLKPDQMPLHFATTFSEMWGATKHRYAHCGHRHHTEEKEHSGMTVHQHTTLSAKDAYAARGGWSSDRSATAVTYHDKHGKRSTVTVTPEMLEAA